MFDVFRKTLTVYRKEKGNFVDGYWVDGAENSFDILASIQATEAEILETLPEGYRTKESYTLYTDKKLETAITNKSTPDIVVIYKDKFLVAKVTPWQHLDPTKHYEVVVIKENIDDVEEDNEVDNGN
jgi:hypothetical protein